MTANEKDARESPDLAEQRHVETLAVMVLAPSLATGARAPHGVTEALSIVRAIITSNREE